MKPMTTYTIMPNGDGDGFNVGIAGTNGARQTMLGFQSEAEAEAWILRDRRLSDAPSRQMPGTSASALG
jgi:hypothetical protein